MRILLLTETLNAGGAETFVLRLARALQKAGDACEILNLNPDLENEALLAAYPELVIHRLQLPARRWLRRIDGLLARLDVDVSLQSWLIRRRFARAYAGPYDVYHSNLFKVDLLLARLKRNFPAMRCVSTLHGDYEYFHGTATGAAGQKILNWHRKVDLIRRNIDGWVHIADHQLDLMIGEYGFPEGRIHKIYNGYEPSKPLLPRAKSPRRDGLTFAMVARGIPGKGWERLIRAFLPLGKGSRLLLVGEGTHLDALRSHYRDQRIVFAGFHPTPSLLLREADVFVFPSDNEALPTVVAESLFCGVPVIGMSVGEVPAMLATPKGELCGQVVETGSKEAMVRRLSEAMTRYVEDRALLRRHRRLVPSAFRKFDMTECARRYRSLYGEVVEDAAASNSATFSPRGPALPEAARSDSPTGRKSVPA